MLYNSTNDQVQTRILSILYKIGIITLFYEFIVSIVLLPVLDDWLWILGTILSTSTLNFCMFIMMDHNHNTYYRFLRILYVTKLYWIGCCCCIYMVPQQENELNEKKVKHLNVGKITKKVSVTKETKYDVDVHDIKPDHAKIEVRRIGSEFETCTIEDSIR